MSTNLENSAVPAELENISFHFNFTERPCKKTFKLSYNYSSSKSQKDKNHVSKQVEREKGRVGCGQVYFQKAAAAFLIVCTLLEQGFLCSLQTSCLFLWRFLGTQSCFQAASSAERKSCSTDCVAGRPEILTLRSFKRKFPCHTSNPIKKLGHKRSRGSIWPYPNKCFWNHAGFQAELFPKDSWMLIQLP